MHTLCCDWFAHSPFPFLHWGVYPVSECTTRVLGQRAESRRMDDLPKPIHIGLVGKYNEFFNTRRWTGDLRCEVSEAPKQEREPSFGRVVLGKIWAEFHVTCVERLEGDGGVAVVSLSQTAAGREVRFVLQGSSEYISKAKAKRIAFMSPFSAVMQQLEQDYLDKHWKCWKHEFPGYDECFYCLTGWKLYNGYK